MAQGSSYSPLTIDVNVSPTASTTTSVPNSVSVSGGGVAKRNFQYRLGDHFAGSGAGGAEEPHRKLHPGPDRPMEYHRIQHGIRGMTYGTISVSDTLPTGYTLNSFAGTGWSCSGTSTVTCTSTAGISGGSDSVINLTVDVPPTSPVSVSNTAKAWGGGDLTHTSLATAASGTDTATVIQVPASVTISAGNNQSATIGNPFSTALSVTVKDANSVVIPAYNVTFTASTGSNGQSGTFSNSTGTITVPTGSSGVTNGVASAGITANSKAGSYSVTATAGSASATFNLTNTPGLPANIALTSGSGQSAAIRTAFANPLIATVTDAGGNLLSGVTVTFTAPTGLNAQPRIFQRIEHHQRTHRRSRPGKFRAL